MKSEVSNIIHFEDGRDGNFVNIFKSIFPKKGFNFTIWSFEIEFVRKGSYNMILDINIEPHGSGDSEIFTYKKFVSDMTIVDSIKMDPTGAITRKHILNLVGNDTFIEELDEFLNRFEDGSED